MAPRSGYRRVGHGSPLVDLDVVFADDRLVDGIAESRPASRDRSRPRHRAPSGDPLMDLFQAWRNELTAIALPPAPDVRPMIGPSIGSVAGSAIGPVNGLVPPTAGSGKRSLRPALAIAAAIAALLVGTATVGSRQASPDSALWAVTQVLWPDRALSVASQHNVKDALEQAQKALNNGRTQDAQLALLRAAVELGKVDDVDGRVDMQARVDELWRAAAPQELPTLSLSPEMLAGGEAAAATEVGPTTSAAAAVQRTPARSASSTSGQSGAVKAPLSPAAAAVAPVAPVVQADSSPANPPNQLPPAAGPVLAAGGQVSVPPGPAVVGTPVNPVVPPPVAVAPTSAALSPVAGPVATPVAPPALPPPVIDPVSAPSTVSVPTPPPPGSTAASPVSSSPDTTASSAPPAPAPAPTGTGTGQTDPGTSGYGATGLTAAGQQTPGQPPGGDPATTPQAPTG